MTVIDLAELEVYKCPGKKVRLGNDNDGGYLISFEEGKTYDCLLSCGVGDDSTFEEDFIKMYPDADCYAFDGTTNNVWPSTDPKIKYIPKNIGTKETETETNLISYIDKYKSIFLKMDIEGHEFSWLAIMTRSLLKKFKQIVIEFHYPISNDFNWSAFSKLNKTHWLVHLHPHNACGNNEFDIGKETKLLIPNLIECTYVLKEHPEISTDPIPSELDQPANKTLPETVLVGYPYNSL